MRFEDLPPVVSSGILVFLGAAMTAGAQVLVGLVTNRGRSKIAENAQYIAAREELARGQREFMQTLQRDHELMHARIADLTDAVERADLAMTRALEEERASCQKQMAQMREQHEQLVKDLDRKYQGQIEDLQKRMADEEDR